MNTKQSGFASMSDQSSYQPLYDENYAENNVDGVDRNAESDYRSDEDPAFDDDSSENHRMQGGGLDRIMEEADDQLHQEFQLINQGEVNQCISKQVSLQLKYAVLSGCYLHLYEEVPPDEDPDALGEDESDFGETPAGPPKQEYIVMRKQGILDRDERRLQFVI